MNYTYHTAMTARVIAATVRQEETKASTLVCYQCKCEGRLCYVVKLKHSMYKFIKKGRQITCPIHECTQTTSQWALRFHRTLVNLNLQELHGIVWDWFDVPENHHMHIDAAVFLGTRCIRFEIDGEAHFDSTKTQRDHNDVDKDAILRRFNVKMLRLHYMDADIWAQCILSFLNSECSSISYTPSYSECLEPHETKHVLSL